MKLNVHNTQARHLYLKIYFTFILRTTYHIYITFVFFQEAHHNRISRHSQLLRKITETCPRAFNTLVQICRLNFWDAAEFLESFKKSDCTQSSELCRGFESSCSLSHSHRAVVETDGNIFSIALRRESVVNIPLTPFTDSYDMFHVTRATQFCTRNILTYSMKSKNRGVLFLVNIIEIQNQPHNYRNGAILDKEKMITLFRQFGFEIFYYENLKLKEFRHLVDELIKSRYLRATDCLGKW